MANPVQLRLIAEKTLHSPANPDLLAYSPSMELLAVGSADHNVLIYRLNGQRVFSASQKVKGVVLELQKLVWKPNGQLIAIAWSDGTVRLIGAESNKTVHQVTVSEEEDIEVTCLAWTSYSAASKTLGDILAEAGPLWKSATGIGAKGKSAQLLDLPRDLAAIDIESSLPKLSVLPSGGTTEDIFSSRASLDALFRPFDPADNDSISIMVVGTSTGHIHLSIFDSFVIGTFPPPLPSSKTSRHQLVLHASHPHHATHALLMKSTSTLVGGLFFVPMRLGFLTAESSGDLSLLASRSSALQNLLRYVQQVQMLMAAEYQATQDLPRRFLGSIDETLAERGDWTIAPALYHQVVTGHTLPEVKEWLVDELAERGHKRWDKTLTTSLTTLVKLTHSHLLPALERAALLLSRLHGLASYHAPSTPLGFSATQIKALLDTLASLNLAATRILSTTVAEIEGWTAFGAWVRGEIDRLAAGESAAEGEEKEAPGTPTRRILEYIQGSLTGSPLERFFTPLEGGRVEEHAEALGSATPLFEAMAKALNDPDASNPFHTALPNIAALTAHLTTQAQAVSSGIADAEKRNVRFGEAVEIGVSKDVLGEEGRVDMKMCSTTTGSSAGEGEGEGVVYIATSALNSPSVSIQRVSLPKTEGKSGSAGVKVDVGGLVRDVAFLDEEILLLLIDGSGSKEGVYILALPFRSLTYTAKPGKVMGEGRRFRVGGEGGEAERIRVGGGRVVVVGREGREVRVLRVKGEVWGVGEGGVEEVGGVDGGRGKEEEKGREGDEMEVEA
ncbi:hypothetical protein VE03_09769 [Pseudogymnoascus sp. 23342-1-I1]|nr:hypothetical protein VE03_09769 [Pseudogymnoascus sp. 23342-1-I1]